VWDDRVLAGALKSPMEPLKEVGREVERSKKLKAPVICFTWGGGMCVERISTK
jgi:hypothetical protein